MPGHLTEPSIASTVIVANARLFTSATISALLTDGNYLATPARILDSGPFAVLDAQFIWLS